MANRYAVANGNWSSTSTWDGGTLPQAGDDGRANGFAVTINQDINVASIRTDASSPAVAGGSFTVSGNGRILTCDVQTGTTTCLFCTTNISWFLYGNVRSYTAADQSSIRFTTTAGANLTIIGTVNGNNSTGGSNNTAIRAQVGTTVNVTGNVVSGNGNFAVTIGYDSGISLVCNITGNITGGGLTTGCYGVSVNGTSTVNGICTGGIGSAGLYSATQIVSGNIIAQGCATIGGLAGIFGGSTSNVTISEAIFTDCPPTSGKVRFKNINPKVTVLKANGTSQQLVEAGASGDFPIAADVRSGISYASGSLTGTLAVPLPANVRKGVPTDNTVGTADLTAADFWNTLTSTLTTAGSIGERLKTASTVQTTGDQLASYQV